MTPNSFSSLSVPLRITCSLLLASGLAACSAPSDSPAAESETRAGSPLEQRPPLPADSVEPVKILLLGTFHFDDAGLDSYKPEHRLDILSERRQKEIEEVLHLLAKFEPTRIGVEVHASDQEKLDRWYDEFRSGAAKPSSNEIVQLGFRLAARLGHDGLYAIDARGRSYFPEMTDEEWTAREESLMEGIDPARIEAEEAWEARFQEMYRFFDRLKTSQTIREALVRGNEEKLLAANHGAYLVGGFKLGRGEDYFGADARTAWFNRNLRIFQNIQRIPQSPGDRILVVIGDGHLPILRHCVQASPEYELVEVREVLAPGSLLEN